MYFSKTNIHPVKSTSPGKSHRKAKAFRFLILTTVLFMLIYMLSNDQIYALFLFALAILILLASFIIYDLKKN